MKLAQVKKGLWYETTKGIGECVNTDRTFPAGARIRIDFPYPRGAVNFDAKEILREVPKPEPAW